MNHAKLRSELSDFAANLEASTRHLTEVEQEFRNHVEVAFRVVENECQGIRSQAQAKVVEAKPLIVQTNPFGIGFSSNSSTLATDVPKQVAEIEAKLQQHNEQLPILSGSCSCLLTQSSKHVSQHRVKTPHSGEVLL